MLFKFKIGFCKVGLIKILSALLCINTQWDLNAHVYWAKTLGKYLWPTCSLFDIVGSSSHKHNTKYPTIMVIFEKE